MALGRVSWCPAHFRGPASKTDLGVRGRARTGPPSSCPLGRPPESKGRKGAKLLIEGVQLAKRIRSHLRYLPLHATLHA